MPMTFEQCDKERRTAQWEVERLRSLVKKLGKALEGVKLAKDRPPCWCSLDFMPIPLTHAPCCEEATAALAALKEAGL